MENSKKKAWKPVSATLMLLAAGLIVPVSVAQTNPSEELFKSKCASCHGPNGAAKTPMGTALKIRDLHSDEVQKQTDADFDRIIAKGKNKMPAFDGKLKKEQIGQLVGFVRDLGKKK
jgi:mono/diheme cytochrome c family protein